LIVEKPFGVDYDSSIQLSKDLTALWDENEIFRIDHYLGKDMVQNLLAFRFANIWELIWNKENILNVKIVFKENFGTFGRGSYFDSAGIIRDVLQNHILQVLAIIAMEPPSTLSPDIIREMKVKVLNDIDPITFENIVLGQYIRNGSNPGYREDSTVPQGSTTPTFAQAIVHINNQRWKGVPFLLLCAKAVEENKVEIRIRFKSKNKLFDTPTNELVIRIQPNPSIFITQIARTPGLINTYKESTLNFPYSEVFTDYKPDPYELLISEAIKGNSNSFVCGNELESSWRIVTPILKQIEKNKKDPHFYIFGSTGPEEATTLAKKYSF